MFTSCEGVTLSNSNSKLESRFQADQAIEFACKEHSLINTGSNIQILSIITNSPYLERKHIIVYLVQKLFANTTITQT